MVDNTSGSNSGSGAAKRKAVDLDSIVEQYSGAAKKQDKAKQSTVEDVSAKKFAAIEENPFYKIVFAEGDPEEKKAAIAKELAFDTTKSKEENKQSLAEFELFKEWLMSQRKEMAQQIIRLTDTEAFSELKDVFDQMNNGLIEFEEQMQPLTDILDAVYELRMASNGEMFDIFKEIKEDKEEEARIAALREQQDTKMSSYEGDINRLRGDVAALSQDKPWYLFGKVRQSALEEIARKELAIHDLQAQKTDLQAEIENTKVARESKFAEFAEQKAKLRELLDISSAQHKARQEALVKTADDFVNITEARTGSVLDHLGDINAQIDRLGDNNGGMRNVYAIISEAVGDAEQVNKQIHQSLTEEPEDESNIAKMKRENSKMAVENHVTALSAAKVDTAGTFADLTTESYRIKSMKDANDSQIAKTRSMHTQGVAGVASRLSTVLQGVSMAALTESSEVAHMTLERMRSKTNDMSQKGALRNAMGIRQEADQLTKAIEELEKYGKVARAATNISREGYTEIRQNLEELQKTAKDVGQAVREAVAVGAEVMQAEDANQGPAANNNDKPEAPVKKKPGADFGGLNM